MITLPSGQNVRVWIATGHTDMRCGFPSLALRVRIPMKPDGYSDAKPDRHSNLMPDTVPI